MTMEASMGWTSVVNILITLVSIALAWWSLQAFRFDLFVAEPKGSRAKVLQMILAVVLGYELSRFFMDYLNWSILLKYVT
jgi:uncharacterized integral membrane protein (TIGR02327 family)